MTRQDKNNAVEILKEAIGGVKNLYLADITGLDAFQTSALRRACFKENIKLQVVKNTLLSKAMDASTHDFGELMEILKGNTSLMFSESGNAPAKVIKSFRKKSDKPILKGAFIEEAIYIGDEKLDALVAIKSKDELIGEIITLLQSSTKNIVSALKSGGGKLSGILKSLSER